MTLKDEILAELRNGTPMEEIQGRFRSKSQLYEAIREFLEEADEIVEERRERLSKVTSDLTEAGSELDSVKTEREEVSVEVQELVKRKEMLSGEVRGKDEELAGLIADIKELRERGFTPEIMEEIVAIRDRSGSELFSHIETAEKYKQTKKQVSNLRKEKTTLKRQVKDLGAKRRKMKEELVSEGNRLDELKVRTATFKEAVVAVGSLFDNGYCVEDINSLIHGLDMLGLKGDPLLSITRLMEGLSKQKSLASLNENIISKRQELATLKDELAVTVGKLNAVKQVILEAFEDVKTTSVTAIVDIAARSSATIKAETATAETQIRQIMEGIKAELSEWSELQQQRGKLEKILEPGIAFLGMLESPEVMKKVPLPLVVQLLERLYQWSEMNLQNVSIHPSENIRRKDFNLISIILYKVPVLIEFVYEGLRQIMIQQSLEANAAEKTSCQA